MPSRRPIVVFAAALALIGAGAGAWVYLQAPDTHECTACLRPIHESSRTVAFINGKKGAYCCPACALSQKRQAGTQVRIESIAEFSTGTTVKADEAYLVRGSSVHTCAHHNHLPTLDKQRADTHFDRCSPSLPAFASKDRALGFAKQYGGQVIPFSEAAGMFERAYSAP